MAEWRIVDERFISYYGGTGHLISNNECKFWLWHSREESQRVCDMLNNLQETNTQLSKEKQLAETELIHYKQRVKDELEMRYSLSNHKPVFEFMAKELDIILEGNVE